MIPLSRFRPPLGEQAYAQGVPMGGDLRLVVADLVLALIAARALVDPG